MLNHKSRLRNLELRLAYSGTQFAGWQIQPDVTTIQGLLNESLRSVAKIEKVKTMGASRTDSGVHAHDQHVNVWLENPIPVDGLKKALNRSLPLGIRVIEVREAPKDFSVRYHARAKHYGYLFYCGQKVSPFNGPYAWPIARPLDCQAMSLACQDLVGVRCFGAFRARRDCRQSSNTSIFHAQVSGRGDWVCLDVIGHHFLYHMVRNMAGSLVKVGLGVWSPEEFRERLNSGIRKNMGQTAPPQGLHLFQVYYQDPPFAVGADSLAFREHLFGLSALV